jgi:hypothetical protein
MVKVDVEGGVTGVGRKTIVRPGGPSAVRSTGPLNPTRGLMVMVDVWEPPAVIVRVDGLVEIVKSGPTTVTITVIKWNMDPLLAKMSTE